jgi:tetratricopeptide (TPR) repeat protein
VLTKRVMPRLWCRSCAEDLRTGRALEQDSQARRVPIPAFPTEPAIVNTLPSLYMEFQKNEGFIADRYLASVLKAGNSCGTVAEIRFLKVHDQPLRSATTATATATGADADAVRRELDLLCGRTHEEEPGETSRVAESLGEQNEQPEHKHEEADRLHWLAGNTAFRDGDFEVAVSSYTQALLESPPDAGVLLQNRSAAHLALGDNWCAFDDATAATELNIALVKAHFRRAVALLNMAEKAEAGAREPRPADGSEEVGVLEHEMTTTEMRELARQSLEASLRVNPSDTAAGRELARVDDIVLPFDTAEKVQQAAQRVLDAECNMFTGAVVFIGKGLLDAAVLLTAAELDGPVEAKLRELIEFQGRSSVLSKLADRLASLSIIHK